ncbi:MAG TPA: hypothetical protein VFW53_09810 [Gallionella sp.]|nr:hypothetical protein [Gallionella sp.]
MHALLSHPAVQAGLAPFIVALVTAELFQRMKLSGLAVIAGFAATVYLVSDFNFEPLTATRKIVLVGLLGTLIALPFHLLKERWASFLLVVAGGAAAVWVVQRILVQHETWVMLLWGVGCASYVAILVWGMDRLENEPMRAANAATALGIGTGAAALIGSSALLGQFGLAIGAAAAAHLLIQMLSNQPLPTGRSFTLPVAVIAGLTGCLAVLSAQMPWYALPVLACIPLAAWLLPLMKQDVWIQSLLLGMLTAALAFGAMYASWRVGGNAPF